MSSEPDNITGTIIENRFEILEPLGQGGMATVYRAKHSAVDLQVAVKILAHGDKLSPSDVERMKREAQVLNSLFHPNIIKVYSFGFLDSGKPYIVLDYLKGTNLDDMISAGSLPDIDWTLSVFVQICKGLAYAHENGLIHRDLKPSNVMIVDVEEDGTFVKLLDFGIAKFSDESRENQQLTGKGEVFGSPPYMSPEHISEGQVSVLSDIYAMGCLMYEVISGKPPFEGKTSFLTMVKHMNEPPIPVSVAAAGRVLPKSLDPIILKCMEKKPADRYQNAHELGADLNRCLQTIRG